MIGRVYLRAGQKLGRPPANLKELLPTFPEPAKAPELLKSPNDGEDFVIVWGVDLRTPGKTGNEIPIVAYEKKGNGGKRHVLRGYGDVILMTDGQLRGAAFPPGYTPEL
jgi:hypothetical protein